MSKRSRSSRGASLDAARSQSPSCPPPSSHNFSLRPTGRGRRQRRDSNTNTESCHRQHRLSRLVLDKGEDETHKEEGVKHPGGEYE
ncbi:unnamed protein product, partial [Protopolystoma xenopodis]